MAHKASAYNDVFEDLNMAEQRRHRQMGFTRGYSVGEEAGWRDGYLFGMRKGAQLSAEIGFYQGFAHAWISILENEDTNKQRKLNALHSLLEMTRSFPRTNNLLEDDTIQKLARIRAKFKQVNALILGTGHVAYFTTAAASAGQVPTGASGVASAASTTTAAPPTSASAASSGGHHPHIGIYHRGASCTSQESGVGSSTFRGVSPTINNNLHTGAVGGCPHHPHHHQHHHHHHVSTHHLGTGPPPNPEMSF